MELHITEKAKKKAQRRRKRNERKWLPLRIASAVMLIVAAVSLIAGIFMLGYESYLNPVCAICFSACLVVFFILEALMANLTSHWITDRLNERMWMEGKILNHFIQTSFAAGANIKRADERGYLFAIAMDTITDAVYDPKSGRIEFKAWGKGYHFSDVGKKLVDREWDLKGFEAVFYDYTEPGLVEVLKENGVSFMEETLKFKIRDARI